MSALLIGMHFSQTYIIYIILVSNINVTTACIYIISLLTRHNEAVIDDKKTILTHQTGISLC